MLFGFKSHSPSVPMGKIFKQALECLKTPWSSFIKVPLGTNPILSWCCAVQWCQNGHCCILRGQSSSRRSPWDKKTLIPLPHVESWLPQRVYSDCASLEEICARLCGWESFWTTLAPHPTPRPDSLSSSPFPCLEKLPCLAAGIFNAVCFFSGTQASIILTSGIIFGL